MKRCSKCKEEKPLEGFHRDALQKDGRHSICKPCRVAYVTQKYKERYATDPEFREHRNEYTRLWRIRNPEAYKNTMRRATEKYRAKRHAERLAAKGPPPPPAKPGFKYCSKCKEEKPADVFYKNHRLRSGLSSYCKPCSSAVSAKWQRENPKRYREQQKRWRELNPKTPAETREDPSEAMDS